VPVANLNWTYWALTGEDSFGLLNSTYNGVANSTRQESSLCFIQTGLVAVPKGSGSCGSTGPLPAPEEVERAEIPRDDHDHSHKQGKKRVWIPAIILLLLLIVLLFTRLFTGTLYFLLWGIAGIISIYIVIRVFFFIWNARF
jgi:hypothetical protein